LKNRRLAANALCRNRFRNSREADRDHRMGTLLGTLQKRHVKPRLYQWTEICPALTCALDCAHSRRPVQVTRASAHVVVRLSPPDLSIRLDR
jgi:hypothetical protein